MAQIVTDADRAEFQAMAEAEMDDRCWIYDDGPPGTDPETGYTVPTFVDIYGTEADGAACMFEINVSASFNPARADTVGEQPVVVTQFRLKVPMSVTGVTSAHRVKVVASKDTDLVGRVFPIDGPYGKTNGVARRFVLKEVT